MQKRPWSFLQESWEKGGRLLLRRAFSSCFPGECSEATLPGGSSSLALPSLRKRTLGLGWVDNSNSLHWQHCVFWLWLWTALEFLLEHLFCNWDPLNLSILDVENHTQETFSYPRKAATELGNDRWTERAALSITWESVGNPCWDHSAFCMWANRWRGPPAGSDSGGAWGILAAHPPAPTQPPQGIHREAESF